ncbi:MAG: CopG family transcriptional regulator [Candidatus Omnitrophica bacterium]|nr:CopG family transcriptional regulator [Candidatus Omnitrophota bacterium]
MKPTITLRLPVRLRQELSAISKAEHVPMSDLLREAVRKTIAIHKFRRLRRLTAPFAEAEGFLTDEDIFSAIS